MLGTSAGAYAAAAIAESKSLDQIAEAGMLPAAWAVDPLIEATRPLFGDSSYDGRVSGVTAAIPILRRRVLSGAQHVLADIVAASSSPLGLAAPHRIGTSRYVDPGYTHMTSADLAPDARVLVLIAPVAVRRWDSSAGSAKSPSAARCAHGDGGQAAPSSTCGLIAGLRLLAAEAAGAGCST